MEIQEPRLDQATGTVSGIPKTARTRPLWPSSKAVAPVESRQRSLSHSTVGAIRWPKYSVSVQSTERIATREVTLELETGEEETKRYRDWVDAELETLNHASGQTTSFQVTLGTRDPYRAVPVEIVYQPSTWGPDPAPAERDERRCVRPRRRP